MTAHVPSVTAPGSDRLLLLDVLRQLLEANDLASVQAVVARAARALTGADGVAFVVRDGDHARCVHEDADAPLWNGGGVDAGRSLARWCLDQRQRLAVADLAADARIPDDAARATPVASVAMVPVGRHDPAAALGAYWTTRHEATDAEMTVLERLADAAAAAMANLERLSRLAAARDEADRARAAMADSRRWITDLLSQTPAIINLLRGPELVVEFAHPNTIKAVGGRELHGKPLLEGIPEFKGQPYAEALFAVYRTGQPHVAHEALVELDRGDGTFAETYWDSVYLPTRNADGQVDGVMTFDVDVTERVTNLRRVQAAQAELRRVEERLRVALEAAKLGTWDFHPTSGVLSWDARCKELFGLPADAAIDYPTFLAGLHPDDRERTDSVVQAALAGHDGGEYEVEYRTIGLQDGVERLVCARGKAFFDDAGRCVRFIGTVQDVTATRQIERLRQAAEVTASINESQFKVLFDFMPQIAWIARPDGHVDFYNRGWFDYTGQEADAEDPAWKNVDPEHLPRVMERWQVSTATGVPFEMELPLRGRDGTYRWFLARANPVRDPAGNIVRWVGISTDIHARKEAGRVSDERLQLLIDSIKDYAVFMLDPEGRVASWNPGAERINQYRAEEIVGRHFSTFYPEADVRAGKCDMELRVAAATGRFEDEDWRKRKDGSLFWSNVIISAIRDDKGQLVGFSKVTRDLTERKQIEEERAARIAAERANRAKDEFLAMLGHELRNPLSPITTALHLMRLRGETRSAREQEVIERQVRHLTRLVDDLLDVSRVARGKVELTKRPIQLADIVARAIEMANPLLEQRRHNLDVHVPTRGLFILADETRMAQVVSNLLTNAAKYTEPEGNIRISASRAGDDVVLSVRDDGIGIPADLLPNVFDLFVQGAQGPERSHGGLGLGLTLVRSLVEMHGGTVKADSAGPGKGSELTVRLPALRVEPTTEEQAPPPAAPRIAENRRRILVVDDNEDSALLLRELLAGLGHSVATAHDGGEALIVATRFRPEIAILDIGLPVMDGYELATRLRALPTIGEGLYLIAVTGYGQPNDRERAERAGFDQHMVKPVDPEALLRIITDVTGPPARGSS